MPKDQYGIEILPSDLPARVLTGGTSIPLRKSIVLGASMTATDDADKDQTSLDAPGLAPAVLDVAQGHASWFDNERRIATALGCLESIQRDYMGEADGVAGDKRSINAGTIAQRTDQSGGVVRLASGGLSGEARIQTGSTAAGWIPVVANPSTAKWMTSFRVSFLTVDAQTAVRLGMSVSNTGEVVGFVASGAGVAVLAKGNGTTAASTFQPAVDGYHTVRVTYDGTTQRLYVDEVLYASTTSLGVNPVGLLAQTYNLDNLTSSNIDLDKVFVAW